MFTTKCGSHVFDSIKAWKENMGMVKTCLAIAARGHTDTKIDQDADCRPVVGDTTRELCKV